MAQRKMQCALQSDTGKLLVSAEREQGSSSRSAGRRRNPGKPSQERAPFPAQEEDGCVQLSFVAIGPDGVLQLMFVPLRCRYHTQLEFIAARNASESNVLEDSGNTAVTIETTGVSAETNELSGNSSKDSMACIDNSVFLPANSTFGSSPDCSKPKKAARKNSKKKNKKKKKQHKKKSPRSGSAESEVCSEEFPDNGTSSSEGCAKNGTELSDESVSSGTSQIVSVPGSKAALKDSKGSVSASCYIVEDTQSKKTNDGDILSEGLSGTEDSGILDSVPVGQTSEDSKHADFNETQDCNLSNHLCGTSTADGVVSDVRVSPNGKKGKKVSNVPINSASHKLNASGNSHARKENNHSVWQKVEKGQANICNSDEKNADSVDPDADLVLKEIHSVMNVTSVDLSSNTEDQGFTKVKDTRKLKRKGGAGSKQEDNYGSRNEPSHVTKAISAHTKTDTQQKRRLHNPTLVNDTTTRDCISRNHPQNASSTVMPSPHKAECTIPAPKVPVEVISHPIKEVRDTVSNTYAHPDYYQSNSLSKKSYVSVTKSNLSKSHSRVYLPHVISKEVAETVKETHEKPGKEDHGSPLVEDKKKSVGEEDTVLSSMSISDNSSVTHSEESLSPRGTEEEDVPLHCIPSERNTTEGKERSVGEEDTVLSSMTISENSSVTHSDESLSPRSTEEEDVALHCNPITEDKERSVGEDDSVLSSMSISDNSSATPSDESLSPRGTEEEDVALQCIPSKSAEATCTDAISAPFTQINKKAPARYMLETDSKMIEQALTDVLRIRLVSDAAQKATGSPIAEIERLIHSASPVMCQSYNLRTRRTGLREQVFGGLMCRQEMPNLSLASLWRWYEKHGSYGLEVMANEFKDLKKLGSKHITFRAYFVPYLSAVQLFGSPDAARHMGQTEHAESTTADEFDECELLYEYFECEQPQRRRPFYDKIKDLTKGGPMPWKMYGDPSILTSVDMKNLHPRSWYAVAWYPIYRIPDDSFRASFLTYHSLGHFSSGANASVVSPVVGLLSYNAKNECWFKPRHPETKQTAGTHSINPANILRDRVTSLQNAACYMSRATVYKGETACLNRHQDFEFFISRQH